MFNLSLCAVKEGEIHTLGGISVCRTAQGDEDITCPGQGAQVAGGPKPLAPSLVSTGFSSCTPQDLPPALSACCAWVSLYSLFALPRKPAAQAALSPSVTGN